MSLKKTLKPGTDSFKVTVFIVISSLVVFSGAAVSFWDYYDPEKVFSEFETLQDQNHYNDREDQNLNNSTDQSGEPEYKLPLKVNIVFLGLDRTEQVERFGREEVSGEVQTDAIIFATLDIREHKVKAITITRDATVPIVSLGVIDKINHAYKYGERYGDGDDSISRSEEGIRYAVETVENLMGAPVDFYITIDIDDLINIVDMIGGIYYYVEQDIRADLGQGRVLIEEGYQHLDGVHFFYYVQYRDIYGRQQDRMDRHQRILKSAFEQFRDTGNISKIPSIFDALKSSINTNLSSRHIGALARFGRELDMEDIEFYSFEGEGIFTELGYYYYIDEEHRAEVLDEMLGVEVKELGVVKGTPVEEDDEADSGLNLFSD